MSEEPSHAEVPQSAGEHVKSNPIFLEAEINARPSLSEETEGKQVFHHLTGLNFNLCNDAIASASWRTLAELPAASEQDCSIYAKSIWC